MFNIGCYVTSRYSSFNEFSQYMDGCIKKFIPFGKPSALVTGDYKSTNSGNGLVARYAFEHNIPLRRFATMWGKHNPTKPGKRNNAGVASNAQIVKNSNGCILFWTPTSVAKWDFMSGGCRSFLRMCDAGHMSRPLIQIKVDIYKPDIEMPEDAVDSAANSEQQLGGGMPDMPQSAAADGGIGVGGGATAAAPFVGGGMSAAPSSPSAQQTAGIDVEQGSGSVSAAQDATADVAANQQSDASAVASDGEVSDVIGNIDGGNVQPPKTANSIISELPIDTNGDGNADTTVTAIDTDFNGSPDAIVTPVDTDNNGTIDKIELSPIPTASDLTNQPPADEKQKQQNPTAQS